MSIIKNFSFQGFQVTVINDGDEIWFKAREVALALIYLKPRNAIIRHVKDGEKNEIYVQVNILIQTSICRVIQNMGVI